MPDCRRRTASSPAPRSCWRFIERSVQLGRRSPRRRGPPVAFLLHRQLRARGELYGRTRALVMGAFSGCGLFFGCGGESGIAVEKAYRFEGPSGPATLLDLFEGRRQLIVYRFFYEPGVAGWPERGCGGCSFLADQVAHLAHLNARGTTLAFVSWAPQPDIERWKARMGWEIPWYTIKDASTLTSAWTSGTEPTSSFATASVSSAPTSSTAAVMRSWEAPGATST